MSGPDTLDPRLAAQLSPARCRDLFLDLLRVPSPQTELLEAEPQLRAFIVREMEPRLRAMGLTDIRYDGMGNLMARTGAATSGRSLMLVAHAMNQSPTTMPNPYRGDVLDGAPYGLPGQVVRGRGASEQKGTMTAMLHAMEAVLAAGLPIVGELHFVCCVSGETGKVDAIQSVVEGEGVRADIAIVYGNSLKLQLGNRGRLDVTVRVLGAPAHSSRPHEGCNAVTGALEVAQRLLRDVDQSLSDPNLGRACFTINGIRSWPDATHTVQARCDLSLDRRLLPGEDPDAALAEITRIAMTVDGMPDPVSGKPLRVEVHRGAYMYPSLVTAETLAVRELAAACRTALGYEPEPMYGQSAFDQGYLNHVGISTVNFGPGEQAFAHTDEDVASLDRTFDAAKVFATLIATYLGPREAA